jgi:hypothetical protein
VRRVFIGIAIGIICGLFIHPLIARYITGAHAADAETAIVADKATGNLKVLVKGQEIARFDANGLHVRSAIEYGGLLTDIGEANYVGDRGN